MTSNKSGKLEICLKLKMVSDKLTKIKGRGCRFSHMFINQFPVGCEHMRHFIIKVKDD